MAKKRGFAANPELARAAGKKGGQQRRKLKGFGSRRDLASQAGKKGGSISKRSKKSPLT